MNRFLFQNFQFKTRTAAEVCISQSLLTARSPSAISPADYFQFIIRPHYFLFSFSFISEDRLKGFLEFESNFLHQKSDLKISRKMFAQIKVQKISIKKKSSSDFDQNLMSNLCLSLDSIEDKYSKRPLNEINLVVLKLCVLI